MNHIVLFQPVIPQNTGSIARLCACTGSVLHLIHPLGFQTDERSVRRAGLDYWPFVEVREHANWGAFIETENPKALSFFSKFATRSYTAVDFTTEPYLIFGSETTGLPKELWDSYPDYFFQIPMRTHLVRSLNLSQCAAIVIYESLRQNQFVSIHERYSSPKTSAEINRVGP